MHKTTDTNKVGEKAQAKVGTIQESAYTAVDYAFKAQEINIELLRRTSQAWIEGLQYQARFAQGMTQSLFGHQRNTSASTTQVERPAQEQSNPRVTGNTTNGAARKTTEPAAEETHDTEVAAKDARQKADKLKADKKAEKQKADKLKAEKKRAEKKADKKAEKQKAEKQRAEKVAEETRKAEKTAEETQEATAAASKSARKSTEPAPEETRKSTEVAAQDAEETKKSTEVAAKDAQKNTETDAFPINGYDALDAGAVSKQLDSLSVTELKRVGKYEVNNKNRGTLRKEIEQKMATTTTS